MTSKTRIKDPAPPRSVRPEATDDADDDRRQWSYLDGFVARAGTVTKAER